MTSIACSKEKFHANIQGPSCLAAEGDDGSNLFGVKALQGAQDEILKGYEHPDALGIVESFSFNIARRTAWPINLRARQK